MSEILNNEVGAEKLVRSIKTLAMLYALADEDLKYFAGLSSLERHNFTPSSYYDLKIINNALNENIFIIEKPKSNFRQKSTEVLYDKNSAQFSIPKEFSNLKEYIGYLLDEIQMLSNFSYHKIFMDFLTEMLANECIGFLENSQEKYNLPFEIGDKTEFLLKSSLTIYTVSEINSLLWSSFKSALAKTQTGYISRAKAGATVIKNFQRLISKAVEEQWVLTKYSRLNAIPQSTLSLIVFNHVLKTNEDGYFFSISHKNK